MAPESAECSLSDASPDDGSEDARDREHSPPPSDSSDDGRERAPRARLAAGTRAVASAERGLGGLARPRPRDLESAPPRAPRARAERPRGARPHGVRPRGARPRGARPRTGAAAVKSTSMSDNSGASRPECARTWVHTRSAKMALVPVHACAYIHRSNFHLLRCQRVWRVHVGWHAHLLLKKVKKSATLLREPIEPYCLASVVLIARPESFADGRQLAEQTR